MTHDGNESTGEPRPVAFVTGASSGIGRAFAIRLAEDGHDLVLVSRDAARLSALADELRSRFGAEADLVAADLSRAEDVAGVAERLRSAERLRLLVNNAGFLTAGTFAETDPDGEEAMVRVHVAAAVRLTHAALDAMLRSPDAPCGIVNVSSVAAVGTSVGNVTYCATKAFLNSFTRGLALVLHGTNVTVQALCPGYTRTEIHRRAGLTSASAPESWWLTPQEVVEASLRALARGKVVCIPRLRYRLAAALAQVTSPRVQQWARGVVRKPARR